MPTYEELLRQRDALDAQIATVKFQARAGVIEEIKRLVAEFDIASREIFGTTRSQPRVKPPTKYRNPATGETWSGRGREPAWIAGRERTAFLINPDSE
ncbi:H-NS histone family protein [Burkholderia sp. MSHR3999]|uniref:H-NS histone family protein n=1 Tax=Burkholderia sp. MSHR3999 TaxID=1542965 RepID=UPI0005ACFF3B|nr:H-NS histone family protein [Burkholderia sp. MSHR3999]KIP17323.1 H-NS histone family protein [Burkholderia sp. MSHR3999]